jgi:hypothetical protein
MMLVRLREAPLGWHDRVFRYSRTTAVLLVSILLALAAGTAFCAIAVHSKPGYYIAGIIALGCVLMRRFITARFRASNWLVRMNEAGLFIQFRSYLNYHLPAEDLTILFMAYPEIRSARLVRERAQVQDPMTQNAKATRTTRYIELELAGEITPLEKALQTECARKAPKEKRWYGTTSTLYEDYPVRMPSPPFLQLRWAVVPGARKFLDALRPYVGIADPVLITQDFSHLEGLSPDEQKKRLRELAQRGQTVAAIYTARKLYKCNLSEAKQLVQGLK